MKKLAFFLISFQFILIVSTDNFECKITHPVLKHQQQSLLANVRFGDLSEIFGPVMIDRVAEIPDGCSLQLCESKFFQGKCSTYNQSQVQETDLSSGKNGSYLSGSCDCPKLIPTCSKHAFPKYRVCALTYHDSSCSDFRGPRFAQIFEGEASFPVALSTRVDNVKVRKGCVLSLEQDNEEIDEFDNNLNSLIDREWQFSNKSAVIESRCHCSPALLSSGNQTVHGIASGSFNDAYILLVGFTGTGKSTLINFLLNNPNATATGTGSSVTSEIREIAIGVTNTTTFHFIDTPGLGDTKGLQEDARTLATISSYLDKHEVLSQRPPDAIFICHSFSDNRFSGPDSQFVKTLKMLNAGGKSSVLQKAMIRPKSRIALPNVLFVFTHLTGDEPSRVKSPGGKLDQLKSTVRKFAPFMPSRVLTALVELKPRQAGLELTAVPEFNYVLPDGELFPQNLFHKMSEILENDKRSAFQAFMDRWYSAEVLIPEVKVTPLLDANHTLSLHFALSVAQVSLSVEDSELSRELSSFYEQNMIGPGLRNIRNVPVILATVKKYLHGMGITRRDQLPEKESLEEFELFSGLKYSSDLKAFLAIAFDFEPPKLIEKGLAWKQPKSLVNLESELETQDWLQLSPTLNYAQIPDLEEFQTVVANSSLFRTTILREFRVATLTMVEGKAKLDPFFVNGVQHLKPITVRKKWNLAGWKFLFEKFDPKVPTCQYLGGVLGITTFKDSNGTNASVQIKAKGGDSSLIPYRRFDEEEVEGIVKRWVLSLKFPSNLVPLGVCKEVGLADFLSSAASRSILGTELADKASEAFRAAKDSSIDKALEGLNTCLLAGRSEEGNFTESLLLMEGQIRHAIQQTLVLKAAESQEEASHQSNLADGKSRLKISRDNNLLVQSVKNNCDRYKMHTYPY